MVDAKQYLIQNIEDMAFFADGECKFLAADLQEATWSNEQEDVYATGKNGTRIGASSRNKASRRKLRFLLGLERFHRPERRKKNTPRPFVVPDI